MNINVRDIQMVSKNFLEHSYEYFRRRYLRRNALNHVQDFQNFPEEMLKEVNAVFVLSTGRCGTDFLYHVLKPFSPLDVHHEPKSKLATTSRHLYNNRHQINQKGGELAFLAARNDALLDAYLFKKIYMETNNRLTFFAPFIENILPKVRFLHLVRHPGDFVRSGMRKGYYTEDKLSDYSKIRPVTEEMQKKWESYSRLEKISWLWYQTNAFIEQFKWEHPDKVLTIKAEHLFRDPEEVVHQLNDNLNLGIGEIGRIRVGPKNVQRSGKFPRYPNWAEEDKKKMKSIVSNLADIYDYNL